MNDSLRKMLPDLYAMLAGLTDSHPWGNHYLAVRRATLVMLIVELEARNA